MSRIDGARAWATVAMVFLFMLINYADKAVVGLSSNAIMADLGLTHTRFGLLGSAFFWLFALSGVAVGFLANRLSTKYIMLAMAVVWALTLLPMSVPVTFGVLLTCRVTLGAAEGPAFPVAMHAVYQWFSDGRRAVPSGVVASGAAFGAGIVAPAITWIILSFSWHAAFATLGAIGLAWALLWLICGADGPLRAGTATAGAAAAGAAAGVPARVPYPRLLLSRTALGVYIAGFGAYWMIALNLVWLANFLIKAVHLSPRTAAWVIALPSATQIVLALGCAALSQRLTRQGYPSRFSRGLLGCACVVIAGICAVVMPFVTALAVKVPLIGLTFAIGSVIFTLGSPLIGEICPTAQRGALLGITNSTQTLAGLIAPLVMGALVDVQADPSQGFRIGFVCAGVLVAAFGALGAFLIHPEADLQRFRAAERQPAPIRVDPVVPRS